MADKMTDKGESLLAVKGLWRSPSPPSRREAPVAEASAQGRGTGGGKLRCGASVWVESGGRRW